MEFIVIVLIVLIVIYFIAKNNKIKRKKIEAERLRNLQIERERLERERLERERIQFENFKNDINTYINQNETLIKTLINNNPLSINSYNFYSSYINFRNNISRLIKTVPHKDFLVSNIKEFPLLKTLYELDENFINEVHSKNNLFIKNELLLFNKYFDRVLDYPLDQQQREAIVKDEDNTLVIAGAGCGKTTTVQGKINYILEKNFATPREILVMSFSKDSTNDLKKKLDHLGVEIRTFHSLAYKIIKHSKRNPDIIEPNRAKRLLDSLYSNLIKDENFMMQVTEFLINGIREPKTVFNFGNYEEFINYLKHNEYSTLKSLTLNPRKEIFQNSKKETLKSEFVKSAEECRIANFLFMNGVEYVYEEDFKYNDELDHNNDFKKKRYRPDFTIYINGNIHDKRDENIIYLEHYGLNKNGQPPAWMNDNNQYLDLMEWKEEVHEEFQTNFIKSYSYEFMDKSIFENLTKNLIKYKVKLNPKSNLEIYKLIEEYNKRDIDILVNLFTTFIGLFKSNDKTFEELFELNSDLYSTDEFLLIKERNENLLSIIQVIYEEYQNYLKDNRLYDFSDLINEANSFLRDNSFKHNYKYIIIDEFQDLSVIRAEMLKLMKNQKFYKLFAVGDDWQSIYRFAGSDLTLFKNFGNHFGFSTLCKIETTYRFNQPLIDTTSDFILKNPNQAVKNIKNDMNSTTEVSIIHYEKNSLNSELFKVFQSIFISNNYNLTNKKILILGRYNHDIKELLNDINFNVNLSTLENDETTIKCSFNYLNSNNEKKTTIIESNFLTIHKSKGLEADYVIVLNCNSGKYGFPAELSDDNVLNLLLSDDDHFENGEERRAFYVAMTRVKKHLYLVTDKNYKSKFILELEGKESSNQNRCPKCKSELKFIKKIKSYYGESEMYGCSSFKYGCDYIYFKNLN